MNNNNYFNLFFKNVSFLFIILFSVSFLASCDEEEIKTEEIENVELPPSISSKKQKTARYVNLTQIQIDELKIPVETVTEEITNHILSVPAFVFPAPDNISIVSAPLDGRVAKIHAHEGEKVYRGQILLELESIEYGNLVAEYLKSKADETYQEQRLNRIKTLVEKKISSKGDLDKAEAEYSRAAAGARAAYSKLKAVGTTETEIENLLSSSTINPRLKIVASISGTIDQHLIDLGQSVIAYDKMLSIIDLSKVLVRGYVSPEDGPLLSPGNNFRVHQKNNISKFVEGEVATINPALDEVNKSIVVNAILDTKNQWPKPGENLKAEITVASPQPEISIPLSAIAYDGDNSIVFVKISDSKYEQRTVSINKIYNQTAIVSSGLSINEEIAIDQIFSLKALVRFEDYAE